MSAQPPFPANWSWPSGSRDTTEFPEPRIEFSASFRSHLEAVLKLDGVPTSDYQTQKDSGLGGKPQRARTYRKMYERLGLLYHENNLIKVSGFGFGLAGLPFQIQGFIDNLVADFRETAADILVRYQLDNPTDTSDEISGCEVHPHYCIWKAMLDLENKIHYEEMNRVILRLNSDNDLPAAIIKIQAARTSFANSYHSATNVQLEQALGQSVHTDQPPARIAPWYSQAGWGGLLIRRASDNEGFRELVPEAVQTLTRVTAIQPTYFSTTDEAEWFEYYLGSARSEPQEQIESSEIEISADMRRDPKEVSIEEIKQRISDLGGYYSDSIIERFHTAINYVAHKHFVILKGVSGTGKSLLLRCYARAIHGIVSLYTFDPFLSFCSVRPDWTDPSGLTGYFDVLTGYYNAPEFLRAMIRAKENPDVPVFVCIDELNLARVEYYFSDMLSAWESREPLVLTNIESKTEDGLTIPTKLRVPGNLYIVGTINIDETTVGVSDKVLDRTMLIDLSEVDTLGFLDRMGVETPSLKPAIDQLAGIIGDLQSILHQASLPFGYRTIKEIVHYFEMRITTSSASAAQIIDEIISQKVLTKIKGSIRARAMLESLQTLFSGENQLDEEMNLCLDLTRKFLSDLDEFGSFHASR